jgi:hypothetical protein
MKRYGMTINFAHTTFRWSNEASGQAAVYCVIVGFSLKDGKIKKLFLYNSVDGDPIEAKASQINAYLIDAPIVFMDSRREPLCKVPAMSFGNMPNDGGRLLLTQAEKENLVLTDPMLADIIKPFYGADDFINNSPRYCFWLDGVNPAKYKNSKELITRIEDIRKMRMESPRVATRVLANTPMLFGEIRQPGAEYILVPRHSSERRKYIPIGFMPADIIVGD